MIPEIDRIWFSQEGKTMDHYFDRLFFSYRMKMLKPGREIFEAVATEAGIEPTETLFLDDGKNNVEAAAEVGYHIYQPSPDEDLRRVFISELSLAKDYFDE